VRAVSGLGGRLLAQFTCKDRNFKHVTDAKIIMKVRLKKSVSFAKFLTIID